MTRRLAAALLALLIASPLAANAQGYGGHRGGGEGDAYGPRGGYGDAPHGGYGDAPHGGGYAGGGFRGGYRGFGPPARSEPGPGWAGSRNGPGVFGGSRRAEGGPRMTGPVRGEYLPPEARGGVVADFQRYHLRRPPRGYAWYRSGDSFILAGSNSGVIFEVTPADPY